VCDLVELPFRIIFTLNRKLKGYEPHTISKRRDVSGNPPIVRMPNLPKVTAESENGMNFKKNNITQMLDFKNIIKISGILNKRR
jgi:hypothetical protein